MDSMDSIGIGVFLIGGIGPIIVMWWIVLAIVAFFVFRIIQRCIFYKSIVLVRNRIKTCCVLGSGGHTMEMIELLKTLNPEEYDIEFILADSDQYSQNSVKSKLSHWKHLDLLKFHTIPRSRSVHQSYFTSIFTTIYSIASSVMIYHKIRPDLVLINGPGTCIPIVLVSRLFSLLFNEWTKIIFIESIARVKDLSLSGKILYHTRMFDQFYVQWPSLKQKYNRTEYISRLL
jgi:beta-1,4-N-acetylglucosaminyltransferase